MTEFVKHVGDCNLAVSEIIFDDVFDLFILSLLERVLE